MIMGPLSSPPENDPQLTLVAYLRAKPGLGDELGRRILALSEPSRAEAGNVNYDLHRSNEDPDVWMIYENWTTSSALDEHFEMPYMKEFVARIGEVLAGKMDLRRFSMTTRVAAPKGLAARPQRPASRPAIRSRSPLSNGWISRARRNTTTASSRFPRWSKHCPSPDRAPV